MDPEGIREVFYAECGASGDYGVRTAMRALPFPSRWEESYFVGVHLPLVSVRLGFDSAAQGICVAVHVGSDQPVCRYAL